MSHRHKYRHSVSDTHDKPIMQYHLHFKNEKTDLERPSPVGRHRACRRVRSQPHHVAHGPVPGTGLVPVSAEGEWVQQAPSLGTPKRPQGRRKRSQYSSAQANSICTNSHSSFINAKRYFVFLVGFFFFSFFMTSLGISTRTDSQAPFLCCQASLPSPRGPQVGRGIRQPASGAGAASAVQGAARAESALCCHLVALASPAQSNVDPRVVTNFEAANGNSPSNTENRKASMSVKT